MCLMYTCYSSVMCMNGTMSSCVRYFSHTLGLIHDFASKLLYLCSHMFRSICSIECIDHIFYVELIVCIICIHMITLGSPYKRHKVLARTRCPVSQARKSWLGHVVWITKQEVLIRVGRTRIVKQEIMARIGKVRIVMHGRLSRGMSALDRELATLLVGLGVWIDIDSNRGWYMGCVCTLDEFLIFQRCWFGMESNICWFRIIKGFHIFQ